MSGAEHPSLLVLDGSLGEPLVARVDLDGSAGRRIRVAAPSDREKGPLPSIDALFSGADERRRIVAVVAGRGPGSYTGVRSVASAALGASRGLGVPLLSVSSPAALYRALGTEVRLPIGAREALLVDAAGVRVVSNGARSAVPTLGECGSAFAAAICDLAWDDVERLMAGEVPPSEPFEIDYPAAPRGVA